MLKINILNELLYKITLQLSLLILVQYLIIHDKQLILLLCSTLKYKLLGSIISNTNYNFVFSLNVYKDTF
jgi:hypothetical protein